MMRAGTISTRKAKFMARSFSSPSVRRPLSVQEHLRFEINALVAQLPWKAVKPFFCAGLDDKSPAVKIMAAIYLGEHAELKSLLARNDVLPDFENSYGISPLMVAAARNNATATTLICLQPLVLLDRKSKSGFTALHYAAWRDAAQSAAVLLQHGADFDLKTRTGETAFQFAKNKKTEQVFLNNRAFARRHKEISLHKTIATSTSGTTELRTYFSTYSTKPYKKEYLKLKKIALKYKYRKEKYRF